MSEFIKAQTQVLWELKKIEEKIGRLQLELDRFPVESSKLNQSLEKKQEDLTRVKTYVESAEKTVRKSEQDLKEIEDRLRKAEDKMREVKTNEEFQAAIKENDGQKRDKSQIEEMVLKLMTELDSKRTELKEAEKSFAAFSETVRAELKKIQDEQSQVGAQLEEHLVHRSEKAGALTGEVAALFKKVTIRTRGAAVVTADNGLCLGCNMKIRPQVYNEVLGFKAIHPCPNCGKIFLVQSALGEQSTPASAS